MWHSSWEWTETPDGGGQIRVPVDAPQPEWGVSRVPKDEPGVREVYLFTTEEKAEARQQEFLAAGDHAVLIQVEDRTGERQRG